MKGIPVVIVRGRTLALAYEEALMKLHAEGKYITSQYDLKEGDKTLDCTMNITIDDPLAEPMIHKAFPGGIEDLREYVMELQGIKDHWQGDINDPDDTRWKYTYHDRFTKYPMKGGRFLNQLNSIIDRLVVQPYSRQSQMITWEPEIDLFIDDPPCVQSIWYRISSEFNLRKGKIEYILNCNIRIRSNDAWGANFMNMFGFIMFNKEVVIPIIEGRTGEELVMGRLNWQADSFHIYHKDLKDFIKRLATKVYCLEDI
ncbi:hypothetical protein LCGC14_2355810, partial [marine sediment metagenome]